jgi:hypothetical protein
MHRTSVTLGSWSIVAALALCAGSVTPVQADPGAKPRVAAASGKSGSSLSLDGVVFRATAARVANQRTIMFAGSPKVLVVWDEFNGGARTSWFALSLDGTRVDQVREADNRIRLQSGEFDPMAGVPLVAESLRATAGNELFIVQFVATPLDEMRRDIGALGGVIEGYLPENGHLVRMTGAARAAVGQLPYVRWVGAYEPGYRLSEGARADALNGADAGAARYSISCLRAGPEQQGAIATLVQQMGGIVDVLTPDMVRMEATLTPTQLLAVARRNEVGYIDTWDGPGGTDMDIARQIGGAVPILSNANFLGQGVRGEVHDTEVWPTHQQWAGQVPLVHATNGNSGTHGSSCYGINFATGTGNLQATGMVPMREQGIFFWYAQSTQFAGGGLSRLAYNTQAVDPAGPYRSSYQTSSVGSPTISNYSNISQEVDSYLFQIDYLSCQSQSNTGSTLSRPQAWAKNIVSVGGVQHQNTLTRTDDALSGASIGPAQDGRNKPDLAHFYDSIFTTTAGDTAYTQFSGTSGATPITAGHFGLLMQMWHEGVWSGFGGGASVFADRPYSTTAKALMIAAAYRYNWLLGGPNAGLTRPRQGWGMADVGKLYTNRASTFIVNANQPVQNGQTRTYTLNVAPGTPELLVTMCYIDPPPLTVAIPQRVNNLSLRVTSPTATVYWGNNGLTAGNYSVAGGVENTVDTVENVFLQTPDAGAWTIEVIGTSVVTDAYPTGYAGVVPVAPTDAAFSLVVIGATQGGQTPCYANCDGNLSVPCLNVVDFGCFLNRYAAGDSYANCDGSTTPPVLDVADFACFMNQFAAGCSNC